MLFGLCIYLSARETQVKAQSSGCDLLSISDAILRGITAQTQQVTRSAGGGLAWPGILRKLDRINPEYDK